MDKHKGCLWSVIALLLMTAISPLAYAGESPLVSSVVVQLQFPEGSDEVHPQIEERIKESITAVASRVLVGQEVAVIEKTRGEISRIIETVFNKVLRGYQINDVKMAVGENTAILLGLEPTSILIEKVEFDLQLRGVDDKIIQVVNAEVQGLNKQMEHYLIGLPIESMVWAADVIEPVLYRLIYWQLPGFTPTVEIETGSEIKVRLTLVPEGRLVEAVEVDMQTQSLPKLLAIPIAKRIESELAVFKGLPVRFLEKHKEKLLQTMEAELHQGFGKHIYLNGKPELEVGPLTRLAFNVDWIDYQLDFGGEITAGADGIRPALNLSLGKRLTPSTVVKLKDRLTFANPSTLSIGFEYYLGAGLTTRIEHQFRGNKWKSGLEWRQGKYGVGLSQTIPGEVTSLELTVSYFPTTHTELSLIHSERQVWVALKQAL